MIEQKPASKTDAIIDQLSEERTVCKKLCPVRNMILWAGLIVIYVGLNIGYHGLRYDFAERLTETIFLFEMGLTLTIFISAVFASTWLALPDEGQKNWIKVIPTTLFGVFIFWIVARSIGEGANLFEHMEWGHCASDGLIMEVLPIGFLIFLTMRGFTTRPYWSMSVNVMAISALGWIGLKLTCSMDMMEHTLINHLLPFAIVAVGLTLLAKRLFKW